MAWTTKGKVSIDKQYLTLCSYRYPPQSASPGPYNPHYPSAFAPPTPPSPYRNQGPSGPPPQVLYMQLISC